MSTETTSSKYCYIQPTGYHEKLYKLEKMYRREKVQLNSSLDESKYFSKEKLMRDKTRNLAKANMNPKSKRDYSKEYISKTNPKDFPKKIEKNFYDKLNESNTSHYNLQHSQPKEKKSSSINQDQRLRGGGLLNNLVGYIGFTNTSTNGECPCAEHGCTCGTQCTCPSANCMCGNVRLVQPEPEQEPAPESIPQKDHLISLFHKDHPNIIQSRRQPKQVPIVVLSEFSQGVRQVDSNSSVEPVGCCTFRRSPQKRDPIVIERQVVEPQPLPRSPLHTPLPEKEYLLTTTGTDEACDRFGQLEMDLIKIKRDLNYIRPEVHNLNKYEELQHKFEELYVMLHKLRAESCGQQNSDTELPKHFEEPVFATNTKKSKKCSFACCSQKKKKLDKVTFAASTSHHFAVQPCQCDKQKDSKCSEKKCNCQYDEFAVNNADNNNDEYCTCSVLPNVNHCEPCSGAQIVRTRLAQEIYKLVVNRYVCDIAITILQRSDKLFQLNVIALEQSERLGCIIATALAVEEAKTDGIFDYFLSFFLLDSEMPAAQKPCTCEQ